MNKDEIKDRLMRDHGSSQFGEEGTDDEVSIISAELPKTVSYRKKPHRQQGFWPELMKRVAKLDLNQAIKVKLLTTESPTNFASTARTVAKNHGFYLNTVYKYPFMYLWPDKMRGRVLPSDFNTKGAVFFENEEEVK